MSGLKEYIKIAIMNLKSNKGRSILTMLGIIIGISSVIMIISIGNGVTDQVNGELNDMAGGQIYIYANNDKADDLIEFLISPCYAKIIRKSKTHIQDFKQLGII